MHARYDATTGKRVAKEVEPFKLMWLEEPVPAENIDAMRDIRASTSTPICCGENIYMRWGFREILEKRAADIIMPDFQKTGGLLEARKIADMAHAYYVPVAPHAVTSPVGMMATAHVCAAIPNFLVQEWHWIDSLDLWRNWVKEGEIIQKGFITMPERAGIGVEMNDDGRAQSAGARHAVVRAGAAGLKGKMRKTVWRTMLPAVLLASAAWAQPGILTKELLIKYTPEWKGERFADGRPKVPDGILKRMKSVTLEEAWAVVKQAGYGNEYEDGWFVIHPDKVLVGRALTAQWLPGRPDVHRVITEQGKADGRIGGQNAWPVDMLQPQDVYVCDHFGLKVDGPSIGDNVGNAIYAKSGNGIVYDGAVRDINGLKELENFTSFVRSYDPSHHLSNLSAGDRMNSTMIGINIPIRIGHATVMPGDVVLGRDGGVMFIPPQLAEKVVQYSEITQLRDHFGHQRLREGKYTAGQIDARWSEPIEQDFTQWLRANIDKLPVPREQVQEILNGRSK